MPHAVEVNFDSLVGPTHNYAGLSPGNLASQKHALTTSNPKQAALQGLAKMKFLHDLGLKQAVLPPHPRPNLTFLYRLGFGGKDDAEVLDKAASHPRLLAAAFSASPMWAANAATISPSPDTADHRVHLTPANLISQLHRSEESNFTTAVLHQIFSNRDHFANHIPLPHTPTFADEGAANHMRMCATHGDPGIEIFIYGRDAFNPDPSPPNFPARQTLQSCQAIARLHQLDPARTVFAQQSKEAIDAGVFHNDVIATANCDILLAHTSAYANTPAVLSEIRQKFLKTCGHEPQIFLAENSELSLSDAVQTYIFNSQLVTLPDNSMALIAPLECRDHPGVQRFLLRVLSSTDTIRSVHYLDVRQSMQNGGGPACLRLRVVLTPDQLATLHPGIIFTESLFNQLTNWVNRHYRDHLSASDLADPSLITESRTALNELATILDLPLLATPTCTPK